MSLVHTVPRTATVIIPSYNYAQFVSAAIESALCQTHPALDVVVVDDGSSDGSRRVIEGFGERITAVFKENGGHGSAINAGCRLARGDVVFLLDSDDELAPDAVETVLREWRPDTVLVHYRPAMIDAEGQTISGTVPAPWVRLEEGDVRPELLRTGGFATTVTSGLVLRRDVLERVVPIPEQIFRQGADGYLVRAVAFLGRVQAIDRPLSRYRRHGRNDSDYGDSPEAIGRALRKRITFARNEFDVVRQIAPRHGFKVATELGQRDENYLLARLASVVVEPDKHPIPGDSRQRLLLPLLAAQWRIPSPWWRRLVATMITLALALLPRPIAWRLFVWRHTPSARPGWLAVFATWRRRAVTR